MSYIIITFVIVKENNVMTQNTTYHTTLNGANWMIIEDKYHTDLYLNGSKGYYFYGYTFHNVDEAHRYLDKIDARFGKQVEPVFFNISTKIFAKICISIRYTDFVLQNVQPATNSEGEARQRG